MIKSLKLTHTTQQQEITELRPGRNFEHHRVILFMLKTKKIVFTLFKVAFCRISSAFLRHS